VLEVMRCVLLCILEAVGWAMFAGPAGGDALYATLSTRGCGGWFCLQDVLEVFEVLEVIRCVLLCMLEAAEGGFCLLEVLEVSEVMCCVRERIGTG